MRTYRDIVLLFVTCKNVQEAMRIGRLLVEQRLVACATTVPIRSCYEWKGSIVDCAEVQLECKTVRGNVEKIEEVVCAQHSYDVPGILVLPIEEINESFADWVRLQTEK